MAARYDRHFSAGGCNGGCCFNMLVGGCSVAVSTGDQFNGVLKVPRGQMRVPGGHLNRLVSHEFLAGFQRDAGHYQAAAKCMPQTVPAKILNVRLHQSLVEPSPNGLPDEWLSFRGDEDTLGTP